jgi:hypothetical protein
LPSHVPVSIRDQVETTAEIQLRPLGLAGYRALVRIVSGKKIRDVDVG